MGADISCLPSIFVEINKRQGQCLKKYVAGQKGKQYLKKLSQRCKKELTTKINQQKQIVSNSIDQQQKNLDMLFSEYRKQLEPSSLKKYGQPQQFGIDVAKQNLYQLKHDLQYFFGSLETEICKTMQQAVKDHNQFIDSNAPQPKIWYFLNKDQRKNVLKQAAKFYQSAIKRSESQIRDYVFYQLDPNGYLPRIQKLIPLQRVRNMTQQPTLKLDRAIMNIRQKGFNLNTQFNHHYIRQQKKQGLHQ